MPSIEIHFKGKIDPSWSDWFQGLSIQPVSSDQTSMSGEVADNAAIYGILSRMSSLGLTLISCAIVPETRDEQGSHIE